MATRRRAREIAVQLLYEADLNPESRDLEAARQFALKRLQGRQALVRFTMGLFQGVAKHRSAIDQELSRQSTNWTLGRMAVIDRNVLRLGVYEIRYGGTPGPVAITEAIQIASRYGDKNSSSFVNGLLDRILKQQVTPNH
jgi:transcription antitermination protein NusB